jgi:diguanylate cyclase (GGDEF)-like protein
MVPDQPSPAEESDVPESPVHAGDERDRVADLRDRIAEGHDEAADTRDVIADARDDRAEARDFRAEPSDGDAAQVIVGAASDRAESVRDRQGAGKDRAHAAADREASHSDRSYSATERAVSAIDRLTAAHHRDAGLVELQREVVRAKRTGQSFVLAFVDLDDLKVTNDTLGHTAGDQRLRQTADAIRAHLRSYDLLVRFGGDEFLCGLLDLTIDDAAERFVLVNADLARAGQQLFTVGLAELVADDSLESLIARADEALYTQRRQRPPDPPR